MSRVGKKPIPVPSGVTVKIEPDRVEVKGPGGTLSQEIKGGVTVSREGDELQVNRPNDSKASRALHGLYRQLIANMVQGVVKPFIKKLDIVGVGYNAAKQGKDLVLKVGFCHPVRLSPPPMIEIEVPGPQLIIIKGPDKQQVGQFAADVRKVRTPDAYKGKGVRYHGEIVRLKAGKAFVGGE
ncbi:MAG: 50S ribosomal protein L6 [Planctomycetota bacterium]|nr:MAG: 50S ribosomal protein L6 [Planctomycetota bacterium]